MGTPVYTADLMLGDTVVAPDLAVQAWERSYDVIIPALHYPLGVTTDGVVLRRDGVVTLRSPARRVITAAPGDTLRIPGPLSSPSPHLYDYAPRLNRTP